jgi:hypothetical protein
VIDDDHHSRHHHSHHYECHAMLLGFLQTQLLNHKHMSSRVL